MGFHSCGFEERAKIKEADGELIEPVRGLIKAIEDRLDREEITADGFGRRCLHLEIKDEIKHRLYAIFNVPSDSLAYGLFLYRIECGEHELPLELPDCMMLPKNPDFATGETCRGVGDVLPQTILDAIADIKMAFVVAERRWDEINKRAQRLVREGYIKFDSR